MTNKIKALVVEQQTRISFHDIIYIFYFMMFIFWLMSAGILSLFICSGLIELKPFFYFILLAVVAAYANFYSYSRSKAGRF